MSNLIDAKSKFYFPIAYIFLLLAIIASIIQTQPEHTIGLLGFLTR